MKRGRAYERFVRPLLFALDPETAHHFALRVLRAGGTRLPLRQFQPKPKPTTVFGITFPNPVGLAAGFDKSGVALPAWAALGFGFAEIGTVTAKPQPGNPRPRIFRFPQQEALINRLGFNNDGAEVVAKDCSGCAIPDVGREFPSASTSENRKQRHWKLRLKIISFRFENLLRLPTTSRSTSARPTRRDFARSKKKRRCRIC